MSKDFDAAVREAKGEPISFILGGQTFTVPSPLPGAAYLEFAARNDGSVGAFMGLLCDWLGDQADAFRAAYRESEGSIQLLVDIASWLVEEATARPTQRPSGSPALSLANGGTTSSASGVTPVLGPAQPIPSGGS